MDETRQRTEKGKQNLTDANDFGQQIRDTLQDCLGCFRIIILLITLISVMRWNSYKYMVSLTYYVILI